MAIGDDGNIIGYGTTAGGQTHAFLLAVPEPSTSALLALAAAGSIFFTPPQIPDFAAAEREGLREAGGDKNSAPHGAVRRAVAVDFTRESFRS